MANILLTRIDNRLIHGQVAVTWVNHIGANLILVADDKVAENSIQQSLMDMAVPDVIETRYFTVQETIDNIGYAADDQLIFLVVRTPQTLLRLVEGGVSIDKVNVGNMHYSEGKEQIISTVSVDEKDIETFKKLDELSVKMDVRRVPDERGKNIMDLI